MLKYFKKEFGKKKVEARSFEQNNGQYLDGKVELKNIYTLISGMTGSCLQYLYDRKKKR